MPSGQHPAKFPPTRCKAIWNSIIHQRFSLWRWKSTRGGMEIKEQLVKKGIISDRSCPVCDHPVETLQDILYNCIYAQEVWTLACGENNGISWNKFVCDAIDDVLEHNDLITFIWEASLA